MHRPDTPLAITRGFTAGVLIMVGLFVIATYSIAAACGVGLILLGAWVQLDLIEGQRIAAAEAREIEDIRRAMEARDR